MLNNRSMPSCTVIPVLGYPDVGVPEEWGGTTGTIWINATPAPPSLQG